MRSRREEEEEEEGMEDWTTLLLGSKGIRWQLNKEIEEYRRTIVVSVMQTRHTELQSGR